jgi:DNA gyrase subunit A
VLHLQNEKERISSILPVGHFDARCLVVATRKGLIKKTPLEAYSRPKRGGIIAVNLEEDDRLIGAGLASAGQTIVLGTREGMAIRFDESDVRPMGRAAYGVIGIKLQEGDEVVGMVITSGGRTLLTVCENGYGKRTMVEEYRVQGRGGQGLIDIRTTERNGKVVNLLAVADDDDVLLITKDGQIVRTPARTISVIGRNTQGVRCIALNEGDRVVAAALVPREDEPTTTETQVAEA